MSVNQPNTILTVTFSIPVSSAAQAQVYGTIVDDVRKTGVADYQLTQNVAAQIVDANTTGAPTVDGQIIIEKNNGQEKRNLGLLSAMRTDVTNNRVPPLANKPINLRPGDKVTTYILLSVASASTAGLTDTMYLVVVTAPIQQNPIKPKSGSGARSGLASALLGSR